MSQSSTSFTIDVNAGPAEQMKIVLEMLKSSRGATHLPKMLEWQVRMYEFAIAGGDERVQKYWDAGRPYATNPHDTDLFMKKVTVGAEAIGFPEPFPGRC